ncbi:hypothetical protein VTN00DRAFT_1867 [Thermoascus crustaceus]|uniref:uncharacterized protein n=1 Tax=Thermoascus crustaceus TaxID=5088 RepID=UPI003744A988
MMLNTTVPQHQRLPPNKRRRRVAPSDRQRVVCACNPCNVRRIKCTGETPCQACRRHSRECVYPSVTERIYVAKSEFEALQRECALLRKCFEEAVPSERRRNELLQKWTSNALSQDPEKSQNNENGDNPNSNNATEELVCRDIPRGRILRYSDTYARFSGASSGGVFIDELRTLVAMVLPALSRSVSPPGHGIETSFASLLGRIHTYDSRPIALEEVNPLELPPVDEIAGLLNTFWGYTEDRDDSFGCGGIYYWGDLREILPHAATAMQGAGTKGLCLLNATLALACQFDCFPAQKGEHNPGETFFTRAKQLLGNPLDDSTLTDMRALTFMSYYLLGSNRRDTAYIYICAAMRIAMMHGLHEGLVPTEQRKREFWNIFILDRWLSCLTGRPSSITNEAITLDLPGSPTGETEGDLPPPDGLRAHVKLAYMMGDAVEKIYRGRSAEETSSDVLSRINDCLQKLSAWSDSLPPSLRLTVSPSAESSNKIILHMIYNQLVILCTRPLLFLAAKERMEFYFVNSTQHPQQSQHRKTPDTLIATCIDAARRNAYLIRGLAESRPAVMMLTLPFHYSFNAVLVLGLALLLPYHARMDDIRLIESLLYDLKESGRNNNEAAKDCAKIVAEFYAIVARLRRLTFPATDPPIPLGVGGGSEAWIMRGDTADPVQATSRRVLSAVELSTSFLPEITVPHDDSRRASLTGNHSRQPAEIVIAGQAVTSPALRCRYRADTSGAEYEIAFLAKSFPMQNQIYTRDSYVTEPPVMHHSNNPVPQIACRLPRERHLIRGLSRRYDI